MKKKKILTIIIPIFNRKINKKILNVFSKFEKKIQVYVIEDGSNSEIKNLNQNTTKYFKNINYFHYKKNKGQSVACNIGLKKVYTNYVWFFDDDDYVSISAIKKIIKIIEKKNCDGYLLSMSQMYNNKILKTVEPSLRTHTFNDLRSNGQLVSTSCSIFKTFIVRKIKGWDENLYGGTDTDLFLRFSKIGKFNFIKCDPIKIDISNPGRLTNKVFRQVNAKIVFLNKHWKDLTIKRKLYYIYSFIMLYPLFYSLKNYLNYLIKK